MDKSYWEQYYSKHTSPFAPSPFAYWVVNKLTKENELLELGCGNARDAVFFHRNGIKVTAIDQVASQVNYLNKEYADENLQFICDDFTNIQTVDQSFDYIYSRFTIHSINYQQEIMTLKWVKEHLKSNGLFLMEVRSIKDELFQAGTQVENEDNAKITDHYRRFIRFDRLKQDIRKLGLTIEYSVESNGLAPYKDEDPTVIRVIAKKCE